MSDKNLIFYCDGSCYGNPGYAGFGIFGYSYIITEKSKNNKHPEFNYYFTTEGILETKNKDNIEVIDIIEHIEAIAGNKSTNNDAELGAVLKALSISKDIENIASITIFTDSNYIVTSYNDSLEVWRKHGWKRKTGEPLVHTKHWQEIDQYQQYFLSKNVKINIIWIKGHNNNYGNNTSDIYSAIGSNTARTNNLIENKVILSHILPYKEYKNSYNEKDFIYLFRDLFFSSNFIDDKNFCFLANNRDTKELGKKDNSSIFAYLNGYVPSLINNIKTFYRSLTRAHTVTCCMKLQKFANKDLLRITQYVDIKYLLIKTNDASNSYNFIRDTTPFIFENSIKYPFTILASRQFNKLQTVSENIDLIEHKKYDITNYIINNNKLIISNKDKYINVTSLFEKEFNINQKVLLKIGYDLPPYLALKRIENEIEKIELILEYDNNVNFYSIYINIITNKRTIMCTNISNKFLGI